MPRPCVKARFHRVVCQEGFFPDYAKGAPRRGETKRYIARPNPFANQRFSRVMGCKCRSPSLCPPYSFTFFFASVFLFLAAGITAISRSSRATGSRALVAVLTPLSCQIKRPLEGDFFFPSRRYTSTPRGLSRNRLPDFWRSLICIFSSFFLFLILLLWGGIVVSFGASRAGENSKSF